MKGIIANCRTGEITYIDDGLPFPSHQPSVEPEGIDLAEVKAKLAEIDDIKAKLAAAGIPGF